MSRTSSSGKPSRPNSRIGIALPDLSRTRRLSLTAYIAPLNDTASSLVSPMRDQRLAVEIELTAARLQITPRLSVRASQLTGTLALPFGSVKNQPIILQERLDLHRSTAARKRRLQVFGDHFPHGLIAAGIIARVPIRPERLGKGIARKQKATITEQQITHCDFPHKIPTRRKDVDLNDRISQENWSAFLPTIPIRIAPGTAPRLCRRPS